MRKVSEKKRIGFLKGMSLKGRLSLVLGTVSFVTILVLCYILVHSFEINMDRQIDDSMAEKGMNAVAEISTTIDKLSSVSDIVNDSISFVYESKDRAGDAPEFSWKAVDTDNKVLYSSKMEPLVLKSCIVDREISASQYIAENTLLNTLDAVVSTTPGITGLGTLFEPNAFIPGAGNYAPYLSKKNAEQKTVVNYPYEFYKEKAYYLDAKEGKDYITDIYEDTEQGISVLSIISPIMYKNEFKGVSIVDINAEALIDIQKKDAEFPTMFSEIISKDDIIHSRTEENGKNLSEVLTEKAYSSVKTRMQDGKGFSLKIVGKNGKEEREFYEPIDIKGNIWWFRISMTEADYDHAVDRMVVMAITLGLLTVAIVITATVFYLNKSLKPLSMVVKSGKKLAEGDFDIEMSYGYQDEIGSLIAAMQEVVDRVRHIISDLTAKLGELSRGNFAISRENEEYYIGAYSPLLSVLSKITTDLSHTMAEIQASALKVNGSAEQVSSAAQGLSHGAVEQASSIQELSATMSEISTKIRETAGTAQEASHLSTETGKAVILSNNKMKEMSGAMAEITEKSNEINKIIKTIDDIAFQTNILSLNAAIEAARAGAAGKGFAVVADEVGNLAQKSAKAAQNTATLIEETIEAVEKGAKITEETAESLGTVSQHTVKINSYIEDITSASEKEADGISQLSQGIDRISSVVQRNSATAQESAAASEELSGQANVLNDLVERFRLKEEEGFSSSSAAVTSASKTAEEAEKVPAAEKKEAEKVPAVEKKETVKVPVAEKKEAVKAPEVEKKEAVKAPAAEKKEAVKSPVAEKKEAVKAPAAEKKETVKAPVAGKKEAVKAPAVEKKEAVKAPVAEKKETASKKAPHELEESGPLVDISGMDGMDLSQIPIPGDAHYEEKPKKTDPVKEFKRIRNTEYMKPKAMDTHKKQTTQTANNTSFLGFDNDKY